MKFGQTLKYNAVPDWLPHYMAYDQCKHMLDTIRVLNTRIFYASETGRDGSVQYDDGSHRDSSDEEGSGDRGNSDSASSSLPSAAPVGSGERLRSIVEDDPQPGMGRSASQAVLHDLGMQGWDAFGSGGMSGQASPRLMGTGNVEEGLSVRQLRARLELEDQMFFDKLASETVKVEQFFSKMMHLLPRYSHAHEQRVAQLLELDLEFDEEDPLMNDNFSLGAYEADEEKPLIGLEIASSASAVASAHAASTAAGSSAAASSTTGRIQGSPPYVSRRGRTPAPETRRAVAMMERDAEVATLRGRICNHYLDIVGLINFSKLNWNAFDKILKKHDKIMGSSTREAFMDSLKKSNTFPISADVERLRDATEALFAKAYWNGDVQAAQEELLEGVRDQIIWSRNTVWRDMLRIERKVAAFRTKPGGMKTQDGGFVVLAKAYPIAIALALFIAILMFPGIVHALPVPNGPEYQKETLNAAHRCLALLVVVVVLWAQDGLPLYVTGFMVLPLTVLMRLLLGKDGAPLPAQEASRAVFHGMSSSTLMLIICVYTLHAALSKFQIDKKLASEVLSRVKRPEWLLLAVMILAVVMSMFVSNVASPVLLNSVVLPVLRDVPRSGYPFVQCILLGIAIASNIGGMPSPISSPQNAVALGLLHGENTIPFVEWLYVTLPLCALMITLCFLVLVLWFKPQQYRLPKVPVHKEKFGLAHYTVIGTVLLTVLVWSVHSATAAFGSAGMVAVLPVIIFYGTGLLDKEDFNNLPWDVVYLVAGGIVLGNAVSSSKLLTLLAGRLHYMLEGQPLWFVFGVFSAFMAVVANMVSHTVSAIIVLPVIMEVGVAMGHPRLLVMGGVLACSGAMALPVSSFPNMAALGVMSDFGEPYLTSIDLLRVGIPMTAICGGVVLLCGYRWMESFGY